VATRGTEALLTRLNRLNRTTAFLVAIAAVLAGLLLPAPYGGVLLLLFTAALAALMATTWPVTPPRMRVARALILTLLAVLAVTHLT
jgi:hypothetical protein